LEGPTDLAILQSFAKILKHPAAASLNRPAVHYVGNNVRAVTSHFWGLREAYPSLVGIAVFDRLDRDLPRDLGPEGLQWRRREIENYLCSPESLLSFAKSQEPTDLVELASSAGSRQSAMEQAIAEVEQASQILGRDIWSPDTKATDEALDPIFRRYFARLNMSVLFRKADYHSLTHHVPRSLIDPEVIEKLDAIVGIAGHAKSETV
jgi:hypothetical protein